MEISFPCRHKQKQVVKRETLILLRVPFSVFFLPVFLFAWSQSEATHSWERVPFVFLLLHLLVYPLIAGFENQRAARTGNIPLPGGLTALLWSMVLVSFVGAFFVSLSFLLQMMLFITFSLAARQQLSVMIWKMLFRGAFIFWIVQTGISLNDITSGSGLSSSLTSQPWAKLAASGIMATLYLTGKIFSRSLGVPGSEQDKRYSPNFAAIAGLLILTSACFLMHFEGNVLLFLLLQFFLLPVYGFLLYWYKQVRLSTRAASFDLSMRMSLLLVSCLSFYFLCVGIAL